MRSLHLRLLLSSLTASALLGCPPPAVSVDTGLGTGSSADGGADGGTYIDGGASDGGTTADGASTLDGGTDADEPSVRILFPESGKDVVICPTFIMVVDIDDFDIVPWDDGPDPVETEGHWHVYDSGDYVGAFAAEWGQVSLDHEGPAQAHQITVKISMSDHTTLAYESTVEILVGTEGCIGGDIPGDDGTGDGGTEDGGTSDGGTSDGGTSDSGTSDGGTSDGGTCDGGTSDGGTSDGGDGGTQ